MSLSRVVSWYRLAPLTASNNGLGPRPTLTAQAHGTALQSTMPSVRTSRREWHRPLLCLPRQDQQTLLGKCLFHRWDAAC